MLILLFALLIVSGSAWLIFRKNSPQLVLLAAACALLVTAQLAGVSDIIGKPSGGGPLLDFFTFVGNLMAERTAGVGIMIMTIVGFGTYMDTIGASKVLVKLITVPLARVRSPYLLLMFASMAGIMLNMAIGSATGLGLLLSITLMPAIIAMGVSPGAAAAVVATSGCMDFGPTQPNVVLSASMMGIDASSYFLRFQLPAVLVTGAAISLFHVFYQRWCDRREGFVPGGTAPDKPAAGLGDLPHPTYAVLPLLPLALLLGFSPVFDIPVSVGVVPTMLISAAVAMLFELLRVRRLKPVLEGVETFFFGMGRSFATVVTLIVAAEAFGSGLRKIGAIDAVLQGAFGLGLGATFMTLVLLVIIAASALLTGSGNAAFFTFIDMLPKIAWSLGVPVARMIVPVQLASGLGRTMSPVAAVIIAVSGMAGISAFSLIRRTIPPMLVGLAVSFAMSSFLVR